MKRRLLTTLTALSLLLTATLAALWIRSHYVSDVHTTVNAQGETRHLASYAGGLHFHHVRPSARGGPATAPPSAWSHTPLTTKQQWHDRYANLGNPVQWGAAGFGLVGGTGSSFLILTFPTPNSGTTFRTGSATIVDSFITNASGTITLNGQAATTGPTTAPANGQINVLTGDGGLIVNTPPAGAATALTNTATLTANTITLNNISNYPSDYHLAAVVPYWFLTGVAALILLFWLTKTRTAWRHHRRTRHGLCHQCGYDLRASTGRCPECGTDIPANSLTA